MSEAETELRQRRNRDSQEIEETIIQDRVSSLNTSRALKQVIQNYVSE